MSTELKEWLLIIICVAVILMCYKLANSQSAPPPPNEQIRGDYLKTQMAWNWAKGGKPDALGFRIYCGDYDNKDATYWYSTEYVEIPDKTARNYLIGSLISEVLTHYGKPGPGVDSMLYVKCLVVAYNSAGESLDGTPGVPANPSNSRFQITGR